MKATRHLFGSGILPRLCLIGFKYTLPFLIKTTTQFTKDLSKPESHGWGLVGAWLLVFIGRAVSAVLIYY